MILRSVRGIAGVGRWGAVVALAAMGAAAHLPALQPPGPAPEGPLIVKPYLQLGDLPKLSATEPVRVLWQAPNEPTAKWTVEVRQRSTDPWRPAIASAGRLIPAADPASSAPYRLLSVPLTRLEPGAAFEYRVSKNGEVVFEAKGKTRAAAGQPYRFAVTGDTGAHTDQEKRIVYQMHRAEPDFIAITGDIVYSTGRMAEYREKYFPIYNADVASAETGAPLIRSRISFGAYGNHDAGTGDLTRDPDGQAYFLNWAFPLNGPYAQAELPNTQVIKGPPDRVKAHLTLLRATFPRMANYSFDYGNAHWTFLDSNTYVDWSDAYLRNWLARDLAAAKQATWKFVVFHHPPFNSSRAHFNEQQMRIISDILEHRGVDIVFNGHVHNYQRSRPLRFLAKPAADRTFRAAPPNVIDGDFEIDQTFDGVNDTTPDGVLYIVTGAGGAGAYDPDQTDNVATWQPFTMKLVSDVYSFTLVDVDGAKLTLRQISETGEELDRIVVTKPARPADITSAQR
jgi:3',5'-cyclic AMP phosphodiesterase CpdA